ncbi:MAG TPA: EscU/YscU/HrcU family type III secretion system export apparatus switch protein [Polyangiaceae bacterium]
MDKTHAPTPRRLRRALEEGDSPLSLPLVRAGAFVMFALLAPSAARALSARSRELLLTALSKPELARPTLLGKDVALIAGPLLAAIAGAALVVGLIQTSDVFRWGRGARSSGAFASPWSGLRAYDAARGLLFTCGLLLVATHAMRVLLPRLATTLDSEPSPLTAAGALTERLLWPAAIVMATLAVLDVLVRRSAWIARWRMSPRELQEERRESEGAPEMKRARRRAHEDLERGTTRPGA